MTKVVHALKIVSKTGQVTLLGVAFVPEALDVKDRFRDRVIERFEPLASKYGRFTAIERPGVPEIAFDFQSSYPENIIDAILIEVANELNVKIYIDPGMPVAEMPNTNDGFTFKIRPNRRRPSN